MKLNKIKKKYDIIIIGCGLSGISLALELNKKTKTSVLMLERKKKLEKDKNWCFWNFPINPLTNKFDHKWNKIEIKSKTNHIIKSSEKYSYNHIYSKKLYDLILEKELTSDKLDILFSQDVKNIKSVDNEHLIKLRSNKLVSSELIFDSRPPKIKKNKLIQHFLGIELESDKSIFDKERVTLMDFPEIKSDIHFFYILPFTSKKALIESTYISHNLFKKESYINDIMSYVSDRYPDAKFTEKSREYGVIPMYKVDSESKILSVIKIGTANNWVRKSSGYAFQNSFINSKIIVEQIINNKPIKIKKRRLTVILDHLFCIYLKKFPKESTHLFTSFFKNLKLEVIVRFLTEKNSFLDSLKVILALPKFKMLYCILFILKK